MKFRTIIQSNLCILTLANVGVFGEEMRTRDLGLSDIPVCVAQCIISAVPASACSLNDTQCQCLDHDLAQAVSACVMANCTLADGMSAIRTKGVVCNLSKESRKTLAILSTSIAYSLSVLFVALRIAGKVVSRRLALNDYVLIAALLLGAILVGCVLSMTKLGYGEHVWNLPTERIDTILRLSYVTSVTYVLALGLIKVSLLLFYLEIFRTRHFKISTYVVLAGVFINNLVLLLISIFVCTPIPSYWDRNIKGKCLNKQSLAYANSASSLVQDVVLLVLPLMFIRNLQMQRHRKLAVGFMFAIGTMGCIATIMRIQSLSMLKSSMDPTWDYVVVTFWTEVELATNIICVSLPSIRVLIAHFLPTKIKEFVSNILLPASETEPICRKTLTQLSQGQKPSSKSHIKLSLSIDQDTIKPTKRFADSLPSRHARSHSLSHSPDGSQRLIPAQGFHNVTSFEASEPVYMGRRDVEAGHVPIEHLTVPRPANRSSNADSSLGNDPDNDGLTALPDIGILPERTFSNLSPIRDAYTFFPK